MDEPLIAKYLPPEWREVQARKHPLRQSPIFWILTHPRFADTRELLVSGLGALEASLENDRHANAKRQEFSGKLRDSRHQGNMAAELLELLFLRKISQQVLYAPEFPRKGPDFRCRLDGREVEIEITRLAGTEGARRDEALRYELEVLLYGVPSGKQISVDCSWIHSPDDLALAYRRLKSFLALSPSEGDHELATRRGPLRVRIWKAGASVDHTLLVSRSWRNLYREGHEVQILRKLKAEGSQLTRRYAAIIVFDADLEYFSDEFAGILDQNYRTVFTNRPYVSGILLKKHVTGEPARLFFGNRFGDHPLRPHEIEMLVSSERSGEQQGSNPQAR